MTAPDPLADIATLRGGEFLSEVTHELVRQSTTLWRREEIAAGRGQVVVRENIVSAALISAAAEIITALRAEGHRASEAGKEPPRHVVFCVQAGKRAFSELASQHREPEVTA